MALAISLGRKSTVAALSSAVVVSICAGCSQAASNKLGEHALLPSEVPVWAHIAIFGAGRFILFRGCGRRWDF